METWHNSKSWWILPTFLAWLFGTKLSWYPRLIYYWQDRMSPVFNKSTSNQINLFFKVPYKSIDAVITESYKYLGVDITSNLSLLFPFDQCYKNSKNLLGLLQKLQNMHTLESAKAIYQSMIALFLVYCTDLNLNITIIQPFELNLIKKSPAEIAYAIDLQHEQN